MERIRAFSAMHGGTCIAYARTIQEKVAAYTQPISLRTVHRCIHRLWARGEIGHERVGPGKLLLRGVKRSRTDCGGQRNWPITRAEQRKARRRAKQAATAARAAGERAQRDEALRIAEARASESTRTALHLTHDERASAAREAHVAYLASLDNEAPSAHVARSRELTMIDVDERDRQLEALLATFDAGKRGKPPDT